MKSKDIFCLIRPLKIVEACKEMFPNFNNWDFIVRDSDESYVVGYSKEHNLDFRVYFYLKDKKIDARVIPRHKTETSENIKTMFKKVNNNSKWSNLQVADFHEFHTLLPIYLKNIKALVDFLN